MYASVLSDASFPSALLTLDLELAEATRQRGCPRCGGPLHSARYRRKPRGGPWRLGEELSVRHSFCCAREGCRRRVLPPSVRFLGRRVYVAAVVLHDRTAGALLGVAIGDAIGLPFEGLSMERVGRRFRHAPRFRLAGRTGFVSDDTEQTVLVGQALALGGADDAECLRLFRRSMVGWLARLPFGIGGATLRACMRMALGHPAPGVRSAGNGAAMRAGILGAHLASDPTRRRRLGREFAVLTHTDPRAIEGALYVAELTANAVISPASTDPATIVEPSRVVLQEPQLTGAVDRALELGVANAPVADAVRELGPTPSLCVAKGLNAGPTRCGSRARPSARGILRC